MLAVESQRPTSRDRASAPAARRILVIEDNPDSRETLRLVLQSWGHQIQVAPDGLTGLQKALTWQPDVAVVDIGLPLLDGFQVAERIRASLGDRIFLLALTGYAQPHDRRRACEAGFDVLLSKPANLDELEHLLADTPRHERAATSSV